MGLGGISHWIIILIIVLVIFGAGRVGNLMGELGKGIRSFKDGLNDEDANRRPRGDSVPPAQPQIPPQQQPPIDLTARPVDPTPPPPPPAPGDESAR